MHSYWLGDADPKLLVLSESGPELSLSTVVGCEALALCNIRQSFEAVTKEIALNVFIWTGQCPRRFVTSRFEGEFSACHSYIVGLSIKTKKQ